MFEMVEVLNLLEITVEMEQNDIKIINHHHG